MMMRKGDESVVGPSGGVPLTTQYPLDGHRLVYLVLYKGGSIRRIQRGAKVWKDALSTSTGRAGISRGDEQRSNRLGAAAGCRERVVRSGQGRGLSGAGLSEAGTAAGCRERPTRDGFERSRRKSVRTIRRRERETWRTRYSASN